MTCTVFIAAVFCVRRRAIAHTASPGIGYPGFMRLSCSATTLMSRHPRWQAALPEQPACTRCDRVNGHVSIRQGERELIIVWK